MEKSPKVLVVGCGGIGGIVAAGLKDMDLPVYAATGNPQVAQALNTRGAVVRQDGGEQTVTGIVADVGLPAGSGPFDYILLATQPPATQRALAEVMHALKADGRVVVFQNGLMESRVAPMVGQDRVVGAIVAWGATQLEPGVYDRTASGGFVVGRPQGDADARLAELSRLLEAIGPVEQTHNLVGARWSKLAINCAISTLGTLGGDRLGALMRHRFIRRLCLEIMTETVSVARAHGIALEKVSGTLDLDWLSLRDDERAAAGSPSLVAKHTLLLAVGARYRRLRSSMLAAIERGRPPAVDFLNGEVVQHATEHALPTPVNAMAVDMVHALMGADARPSLEYARELFERTRHVRGKDAQAAAA